MIKYTFSQATSEAAVDDFINKMTQHLVPKYFSRIEKATSDDGLVYVRGYDDEDVLIFKLRTWGSSGAVGRSETLGISFYCKSTGSWYTVFNLCAESYLTYYINSAYVCNGGITFTSTYNSGNVCSICFDSNNTTALLSAALNTQNSGVYSTSTLTQSGVLSYNVAYNDRDNANGSYYLMPFLTYDGTLKRAWYPIIEQYNTTSECMRIMQLDGKDYFVMPGFLIEDF